MMPDGKVLSDGHLLFSMDRAGRIFEPNNDPIAVLQVDGRLIGKDDVLLGKVGLRNSSPPGREVAWLSVSEAGEVQRFDPEGELHPDGAWTGCGPAIRACTLTTHVITLAETRRPRSRGYYGPPVGIGVGFGLVVAP